MRKRDEPSRLRAERRRQGAPVCRSGVPCFRVRSATMSMSAPPPSFLCPLSQEIMEEPVLTCDGKVPTLPQFSALESRAGSACGSTTSTSRHCFSDKLFEETSQELARVYATDANTVM